MSNGSKGKPAGNRGRSEGRQRAAEVRAAQQRAERQRRLRIGTAAGVAVIVIVVLVVIQLARSNNSSATNSQSDSAQSTLTGPPGPEGIPLQQGTVLASLSTAATGQTVNGIQCSSSEQTSYHIHSHLIVYVNGAVRPIPPGIGIVSPVSQDGVFYGATKCYYWLHVHAQDGVIHVESPTVRTYTLGDFFAIWGQPLSTTQVGPVTGNLSVFVNGRSYSGNPADITLKSHEDIQINVGSPSVPPKKVDWSKSGL